MLNPGMIVSAKIIDHNEQADFAQVDGQTLQVISEEKYATDQEVTGMVYENQQGQWCLQVKLPAAGLESYGLGEVVQIRRDLGVFINIGLEDKDAVISLDELPLMHSLWPQVGDQLLVNLSYDHKQRLWAHLANDDYYKEHGRFSREYTRNETVSGRVYMTKKVGSFAQLDDYRLAFIHYTERQDEPHIGQAISGRVIGLTQDGRLSVSLKPLAYVEIADDAKMIMAVLQRAPEYHIAYQDKSDPSEIKDYFGISKGAFKRALGSLLKLGYITTDLSGTTLTAKGQEYHE
ncbi:S1 RNA-binding domain-containing protein [Lapidilactobacillus wuchangensis]|uniref:DNA-binding protein n=1 Tax=Lapidilactobacillus wuchangensis TaxID=2486001 RepID=UPI000F7B7F50|nr:DNA-binding protein [Lapidilactobacillus wuchangensis]